MRSVTLIVAAMALMVPLFAAVAYAATIEATSQQENRTVRGRGTL